MAINTASKSLNSLKNMSSGVVYQTLQAVLSFVNRTVFVSYLSIEYLGLNGLFTSIITILSLAELGIGSAFAYSLYKPIANRQERVIASIVHFYKKAYYIVGGVIFVLGLAVTPFLHLIIPEKPEMIEENLQLLYILFLLYTASSYFFAHKIALIIADQRNYITSLFTGIFLIVQTLFQILILVYTQNFLLYIIIPLITQLLANIFISEKTNNLYPFLNKFKKEKLPIHIKKEIFTNTKATFLTKIAGVIVNNTDNIFINYLVGLSFIGFLSNYNMLIFGIASLINVLFNGVSASVAQVNAGNDKEKQYHIFKALNLSNFWIFGTCALLFYLLANDFIRLWIGQEYLLDQSIVSIIAVNFFMVGMQNAIWTYKSTFGLFRYGKWLTLVTAVLNIIFTYLLGTYLSLFGILLATALARLLTNFSYDPYIVFKLGFKLPPTVYLQQFLVYIIIIGINTFLLSYLNSYFFYQSTYIFILKLGMYCLFINITFFLVFRRTKSFSQLKKIIYNTFNIIKTR